MADVVSREQNTHMDKLATGEPSLASSLGNNTTQVRQDREKPY